MNQFLGYAHPDYAKSLFEFGSPRFLPECEGWILERGIPGFDVKDAMGCYPVFTCAHWDKLGDDLSNLADDLVSLAMVTDPFGEYDPEVLGCEFDVFYKYKDHFVSDLTQPLESFVRRKTRRYARQALEKVSVERYTNPLEMLDEWIEIYDYLIKSHHLKGIHRFSANSFRILLGMPGVEMFVAQCNNQIVGADVWIISNDVAYAHLSAISSEGYQLSAAYALCWIAMQHYSKEVHWIDHGGLPGVLNIDDTQAVFKRGWATGEKSVYFCGRILNQEKYYKITKSMGKENTNYFPTYRAGEFS